MESILITEQKVLDAEKQLSIAMKDSNVEMLDELIHGDLLFILPTGETITKEMDLAIHKSGQLVLEEILPCIETIKLIDDIVVVTVTSKLKGKMQQQPFEGQFRYLRVWKIFDGKMKVIAGSCNAL